MYTKIKNTLLNSNFSIRLVFIVFVFDVYRLLKFVPTALVLIRLCATVLLIIRLSILKSNSTG